LRDTAGDYAAAVLALGAALATAVALLVAVSWLDRPGYD
jgi:hypothetical protein